MAVNFGERKNRNTRDIIKHEKKYFTLILVSATPPLLALGAFTTMKGSFPPLARDASSSACTVARRNLSN